MPRIVTHCEVPPVPPPKLIAGSALNTPRKSSFVFFFRSFKVTTLVLLLAPVFSVTTLITSNCAVSEA